MTSSDMLVGAVIRSRFELPEGYQDAAVGFRYVLVPRETPLPEPSRDLPRARALVDAARAAEQKGDLAEAYRLLTEAIDAAPLEAPLWNARALLRHKRGDTWGAIWDCTRGIDLQPQAAALWINRASARAEQLEYEEAVKDLDRALELQPAAGFVWVDRAHYRAALKDLDGAIADLEEAIRRAGTPDEARRWRQDLEGVLEFRRRGDAAGAAGSGGEPGEGVPARPEGSGQR